MSPAMKTPVGKPPSLESIREALVSVLRRAGACKAIVFGSYARGEARRRSDLDILVRFLEGASLFDLVGLADFLEENLGLRVDVVSERALRPELRERILSEVVQI